MHTNRLFLPLSPSSLASASPRGGTDTSQGALNERGVKWTLISNRGTFWISMGLGPSHVWASVKDTVCGSVNWTRLSLPGTK